MQKRKPAISPRRDRAAVETQIRDLIKEEGKWVSKVEVSRRIGIPRSSLASLGVDSDAISASLGYPRVFRNPKDTAGDNERLKNEFIEGYKAYIAEVGKPVSLFAYAKAKGLRPGQCTTPYRWDIDWEQVHREVGIKYTYRTVTPEDDELERVLREMIESKKRYITFDEFAAEMGISGHNLLSLDFPLKEINLEYGYTATWKAFESRVYLHLKEIYPDFTIETQKTFEGCQTNPNDSRSKLRYDFYVPEANLLVEADGPSHYDPNHWWNSSDLQKRDAIKNKFAEDAGIRLVRIRYAPKMSREYVESLLSGNPLKHSVGQPAAKPADAQEGSETIERVVDPH